MERRLLGESLNARMIRINYGKPEDLKVDIPNEVRNRQHSTLSLLPSILFQELATWPLAWFLAMAVLQSAVPAESPTNGTFTILALGIHLLVSLLPPGLHEYRLHKLDKRLNDKPVRIWKQSLSSFHTTRWADLKVGHIVLLQKEPVPADILLLATGHKKQRCFVQASGLTGHSNLVRKTCVAEVSKFLEDQTPEGAAENLGYLEGGTVTMAATHSQIDDFAGFIKLVQVPKAHSVSSENVLMRGTQMKSAVWALGLVLYTGADTRLGQNILLRSTKRPRLSKFVRTLLTSLVVLSLVLAGLSLAIGLQFSEQDLGSSFIVCLVYYHHLAPVQLLLTLQMVRLLQSLFISWDKHLFHGQRGTSVDNSQLTDQLGLVDHVFTDKTGTLTANEMVFRKCFVNGTVYGAEESTQECQLEAHPRFHFQDPALVFDLHVRRRKELRQFFKCLSICHNGIGQQVSTGQVKYKARSPDEEALLIAAHCFGFSFVGAVNGAYCLKLKDCEKAYPVLGIHEFTPERQRMSVVVRQGAGAMLYCKGADSVMIHRCQAQRHGNVQEVLDDFARQGLRVMVMAQRRLSPEETTKYLRKYTTAAHSLYSQQALLRDLAEEYEANMQFLGASGIEDRVQDGVPEAVSRLLRAGLKLWMVTGDKLDNAVKTAYSCGLFRSSSKVLKLTTSIDLHNRLNHYLLKYVLHSTEDSQTVDYDHSLKLRDEGDLELNLVITGAAVEVIMQDLILLKMFILLASRVRACVSCYAQPIHKRWLVSAVKKYLRDKPVTLAIGDGPNDVLMLQEADIGLCAVGHEGVRQHSEFTVARFQDVPRLVLFHGRNNYRRTLAALRYVLYKNCVFVLVVFVYGFYCGHSGGDLYSVGLLNVFVVWLALPATLALGVIEPPREKLGQPVLRRLFDWRMLGKLLVTAGLDVGLVIAGIHCLPWILSEAGHALDGAVLKSMVGLYLVFISTMSLLSFSESWTVLFLCLVFFQFVLGLLCYSFFALGTEVLPLHTFMRMPSLVFTLLLSLGASVLFRLTAFYWRAWKGWSKNRVLPERYFEKSQAEARTDYFTYKNQVSSVVDTRQIIRSTKFSDTVAVFSKAWTNLIFHWPSVEARFKACLQTKSAATSKAMVWSFAATVSCCCAVALVTADSLLSISLEVAEFCMMAGLCVAVHNKRTSNEVCVLVLLMITVVIGQVIDLITPDPHWLCVFPSLHCVFSLFNIRFAYRVPAGTVLLLGSGVSVAYSLLYSKAPLLIGHCSVWIIFWWFLSAGLAWVSETDFRQEFVSLRQLPLQYKQFQDILGNLMPTFVKDRVNQGIRYIAEEKSMVTVMFCDIYNFEAICASHTPEELLEMLDTFFSLLDRLCDKHGVAKIETVNKTYMVCGGLDDVEELLPSSIRQQPAAERCLDMAISIVNQLEDVYLKNGDKFQVKIGIHSGPVIAGVVGSHKPQFSLVGDTVNTASRMCSTIKVPGQIQFSLATHELIDSRKYSLVPSKVEAKGKGLLHTFYVQSPTTEVERRRDSLANFAVYLQDFTYFSAGSEQAHQRIPTIMPGTKAFAESEDELRVPFIEIACHETAEQISFRLNQLDRHYVLFRTIQRSTAGVYGLLTLYSAFLGLESTSITVLRGLCSVMLTGYVLCFDKLRVSPFFSWLSVLVYMTASIPSHVSLAISEELWGFCAEADLLCLALVLCHFTGMSFSFAILYTYISVVLLMLSIPRSPVPVAYSLQLAISLIGCLMMNLLSCYLRDRQGRAIDNLTVKADHDLQATDSLLRALLPQHVLHNMKEGVLKPDTHSEVTVLYADISGFTSWASDKAPIQVISMLSKLFCKFDQLCVKHNVYKVHTIGDCYVVLGMVNNAHRNALTECLNVIGMALDMLKTISCLNRKHNTDFQMRIGIHTGTVIAGITGTNIVRYDIYGPDNDVANKAESAGAPGKVNVTADTMEFLVSNGINSFVFQENRPVVFELTKRIMPTHFLFPS